MLHLGPDPILGGGMSAALGALFDSPLGERYRLDCIPTYRSSRPLARLWIFAVALLRLVAWSASGRGRIVHVHATVRGSAYRKSICVLVAWLLRRRVVLQVHAGAGDIADFRRDRGRLSLALFRAAFGVSDVVLAVSAASASALGEAGVEREIEVVPNAAPTVAPFERRELEDGAIQAAYLGGFANPAKGYDVLLEALVLLLPRAQNLRMTLAGPGRPDEFAASMIAAEPALRWEGWLGEEARDDLLRKTAIFVMPSRSEGLPMALLEAMAYGTAVLATSVGGIPELVEEGVDGLLVPNEDPEALADGLSRLAADAALRSRLGAAARARVQHLDAVEVAERLASLYATVA